MCQRCLREDYDPEKNVCENQDDFNQAFREALKWNVKENEKSMRNWKTYVLFSLYLAFFIWAIFLAMKITKRSERIVHTLFAILFGPLYVLSYYLGSLGKK